MAQVAQCVRALAERRVSTAEELAAWYQEAIQLKRKIDQSDHYDTIPHFIGHYLSDADLRFKDPEYAALQNEELEDALKEMDKRSAV